MTNDQRLDRLERILTLIVRAGRRTRVNLRENIRQSASELDEKIAILINAQIKTEDDLQAMREESNAIREESRAIREESRAIREESQAMRDDLYERSRDVFELFRLTEQKIDRLVEIQGAMGQQLSGLIERFGTQ